MLEQLVWKVKDSWSLSYSLIWESILPEPPIVALSMNAQVAVSVRPARLRVIPIQASLSYAGLFITVGVPEAASVHFIRDHYAQLT